MPYPRHAQPVCLRVLASAPRACHAAGEVQFESSNASADSDEAFIQLLAHAAAAANSGGQGSDAGSSPGSQPGSKAGGKRKGARGGGSGGGSSAGAAPAAGGLGAAALCKLRLAEDDVAKVRWLIIRVARLQWWACCGSCSWGMQSPPKQS